MGLLTVAASMALNYSLAPHAELARKAFLSEAQSRSGRYIQGQIFRNRTDSRTWFIQNFLPRTNTFNNVQVLQQDASDNIVTNYVAARAFFRPETKTWELENAKVVHYDHSGNIVERICSIGSLCPGRASWWCVSLRRSASAIRDAAFSQALPQQSSSFFR